MKAIKTDVEGVLIIEPDVFGDNRGYFYESYNDKKMAALGIDTHFIQDNQSFSAKKGTIRGLHFQHAPHAQTKLVRCTMGAVLDVAVDIRKASPTFGKWVAAELSAENHRQLFIPKGMAHGFVTLSENCILQYKVDDYYAPDCDGGIAWNDPRFGVDWGVADPVLSAKDAASKPYDEQEIDF